MNVVRFFLFVRPVDLSLLSVIQSHSMIGYISTKLMSERILIIGHEAMPSASSTTSCR